MHVTAASTYATSLYWDGNGTGINGAGITPTGTWGTSTFWNTSSMGLGGALQSSTAATDDLFFSAGTDATGTFTVTVSGIRAAKSLNFEEGAVTVSGGTRIDLDSGGIVATSSGATTISTPITLTAPQTFEKNGAGLLTIGIVSNNANLLSIGGTGDITLSGVVGNGAGGLTKNGTGILTLGGSNTYTGLTTINDGTIRLSVSTNRINTTNDVTINSPGILDLNGRSQTIDVLDGTGAVTTGISGAVTLTLGNNNGSGTFSGSIQAGSGTLAVTKTGSGTQTLSGNNSYTGTTTINSGGTLKLGHGNALGGGAGITNVSSGGVLDLNGQTIGETINLSGTGISSNGALINTGAAGEITARIDVSASSIGGSGDILLSGGINGGGSSFTKFGSNKVTIQTGATGRNNGASTTSVNGGVLRIENATGLDTANVAVTVNSAVLEFGTGITYTDTVGLILNNGATLRADGTVNINSKVTVSTAVAVTSVTLATVGAGNIFTVGSAANDLTGGNGTDDTIHIAGPGTVLLGQSSNYIGNWSLDAGRTQLGSAAALGATPARSITLAAGASGATLAGRLSADTTFTANPITVSGSGTATIQHDRSGVGNGVIYTFGTLAIGSQTLAVNSVAGGNVNNNTPYGISLGTTTLSGNSVFDVANNGAGLGTLTLASVSSPAGTSLTKNGNGALTITAAAPNITSLIYNAGPLNLAGTLTLGSNSATALTMRNTTINNNIILAGSFAGDDFVFDGTNNGTATLGGTVDIGNRATIWNIGNGSAPTDMQLTAGIIGVAGSVAKTGAGQLLFSASNSYTGLTEVLAGTLAESSTGLIHDSSALTVNGTTATFDLGASHNDTVAQVTLDGGGQITGTGSSALTSTVSFEMKFGSVGAILAGSGINLNKTTAGMVTLGGANTYSGNTDIVAGTLALSHATSNNIAVSPSVKVGGGAFLDVTGLNGGAGLVLGSGQTLEGSGTIVGDIVINGFHRPGTSPDIETFMGDYTLNGDLEIEILGSTPGPTGHDQVLISYDDPPVDYNVVLGATSTLTDVFSGGGWSTATDMLWIILNETDGTLTGAFSNYSTNGMLVTNYDTRNWRIYYGADFGTQSTSGGNDVLIAVEQDTLVVPEPSTFLLAALGLIGLGLFGCRRTHRRA